MKRQPITQKAKSSPFHVNEALISGAAQTSRRFVNPMGGNDDDPDNPKMTRTEQGEGRTETIRTGGGRPVEELADSDTFFKQMAAEAEARGWKGSVQDYIKQKEQDLGYTEKEEKIKIPGEMQTKQRPYYTKKRTDVLTSPKTRKVGRKGLFMSRHAGKLGAKEARLEDKVYRRGGKKLEELKSKLNKAKEGSKRRENLQKRLNKFEDELSRDPSYQRAKRKLDATKRAVETFDNFRAAQNAATSKGKAFGRRDVGYGRREMGYEDFSTNKQQEMFDKEPMTNSKSNSAQASGNLIKSFSSKYDPNYNLSGYSVFDNKSFTEFVGKERMKKGGSGINMNSKSAFKMKGYGSKTYKK